jgi:tetratricopeptide (TPR) repeat protein
VTPRVYHDAAGVALPTPRLDDRADGDPAARIPAEVFAQIKVRAGDGERQLAAGRTGEAFDTFYGALELLPEGQAWNAAGWLLVAMATCVIKNGEFSHALAPLRDSLQYPGTLGNPWVHLLLGRVRLELGDDRAIDDLARAYEGGGAEIFDGLDPKYLAAVERGRPA